MLTLADLKHLVRTHFPHCPGMYIDEISERLAGRDCPAAFLKQEIAAMAEAVIRHQLTDYDRLRTAFGMPPEEARLIVTPEISDWLASWRGT
jgi:hypothetical protein